MKGAWIVALALAMPLAMSRPQQNQTERPASRQTESNQQQYNSAQSAAAYAISSKKLQDAARKGKKSASDKQQEWWESQTIWSASVALFTLCLVGVGIGQIVVYWKQKGVMERSLIAARKSFILTRQSLRLARREFNLVHRPRLIARSFFTICGVPGMPNRFHFSVYNAGDQEGTMKFEACTFYATLENDEGWNSLLAVLDEPERHSHVIRVGETQRHKVRFNNGEILSQYRERGRPGLWAPEGANVTLRFSGDMTYLDQAGETRHCSFDRTYDFQAGRFTQTENSEFEHGDKKYQQPPA